MNEKELIEELRFLSSIVPEDMCDRDGKDALEKAADAIETLLAERDAAVEMLRGACLACKHINKIMMKDEPCFGCKWLYGTSDKWEWRGI